MSNCIFLRVSFVVLEGQNYQHDGNLRSCAPIHYISTLFPPTHDMRWLIDGKFRGVASNVDGLVSIWMFRGGRRQISRGADSKHQYWYWTTINHDYRIRRVSINDPWYTRPTCVRMAFHLYRCGKLLRRIDVKIKWFYRKSRGSSTSTKSQGLLLNK